MGWNSAGDIFDPVCTFVVKAVESNGIAEADATALLTMLIAKLQNGDWDVEEESLSEFVDYPFVVAAFKAQGVEVQDWMLRGTEGDVEDDGTCGDCADGRCHGGEPGQCGCARHDASQVDEDEG